MPAMPLTGDAYSDISDSPMTNGRYEQGMGLTKREHYAGLAMQGFIAGSLPGDTRSIDEAASLAVKFSDALLKELDK